MIVWSGLQAIELGEAIEVLVKGGDGRDLQPFHLCYREQINEVTHLRRGYPQL
jgi:hypothetical protein